MKNITTAIVPVAGLGTRFLPITKSVPKEMLPIVDTPVIEHIVRTLTEAGIEKIIFVTAQGKGAVEDYFDKNIELEQELRRRGSSDVLYRVTEPCRLAKYAFVKQLAPNGDVQAIKCALPFIGGDESVVLMFGDAISYGESNAVEEVMNAYYASNSAVIGLNEVPEEDVHLYGIVKGSFNGEGTLKLSQWEEKPERYSGSNLAWNGCAVLTPFAIERIKAHDLHEREMRTADVFRLMIEDGYSVIGKLSKSKWFDCGKKIEYIKAQIHFALGREDMREELLAYMRGKV